MTNIVFSQVSGTILMDSLSLPGAEIKFKKSNKGVMADFDGIFVLPLESEIKNNSLVISYAGLSIEIKNIELNNGKLNIGEFEIPYFKDISITEFEQLSESEKENCLPTYCWGGQLLGYYSTNKLEQEYLTLNCKERITEFEFNPTTKTIIVDWNLIKQCK
ncbi:carboxypeptidase-like regulatory domain-containing protein [Algibacter lectus]|uniref:carboxypeptidase-like regulatory domain-containing protein n=1 Tax=Algibacter lectus TaxID=221126 RepID=UPI0012698BBF|nr:carboxypeptidase-like regulatory domain-containing protein [Algibacter lectus]